MSSHVEDIPETKDGHAFSDEWFKMEGKCIREGFSFDFVKNRMF